MRFFYLLRVLIINVETLLLSIAGLAWVKFPKELQSMAELLELDQDVLKYLMLLPVAVATWVINECRGLLQEDNDTVRLLTLWGDYWRLKTHVWVAVFYAFVFALASLVPWTAKSGIGTGAGLLLFVLSVVGQFFLAASVYAARIRLRELIAHAKAP